MKAIIVITFCLLLAYQVPGQRFKQNKRNAATFSSISTSESGELLKRHLGRNCEPGPNEDFPIKNQTCYAKNLKKKRPHPGSCNSYLQCDPGTCLWTEHQCPPEQYWNQHKKQCVPRQQADCAPALFGRQSKVIVVNPESGKVIDDCRGCPDNNHWKHTSEIIGYTERNASNWNQVLVAKQLEDNGYYYFAFDRVENREFKVLSVVKGLPKSQLLSQEHHQDQQWRVIPTHQNGTFQIVSVSKGQALTMLNICIAGGLMVDLQQPYEHYEAQLFQFKIVTGKKFSHSPHEIKREYSNSV